MNLRFHLPAALALLPVRSWAETAAPVDSGSLAQVVFGLGVVLILLVASLWLLKRLTAPRGSAAGFLKVITAAAVGPRERVVVVEVGETWLVLGVAPGQVSALHQMPRQEMAASVQPGDFAARLRQFMERGSGRH
jgi:flagellar protein FliO/FliZ